MFGIYCVVARLANIIGPKNTHGVIYDFIRKLTAHQDFLDVLGNGQQDKSYLYIDDCVSALMLLSDWIQTNSGRANETNENIDRQQCGVALKNPASESGPRYNKKNSESQFQVFNIGSDDTITVLQIAQIVMEQLSLESKKVKIVFKNNFEDGRGWKGDVSDFWLDCSKLRDIGWKPKYNRSKDAVLRACKEYVKREKGSATSVG